jgi:hypothetical protein
MKVTPDQLLTLAYMLNKIYTIIEKLAEDNGMTPAEFRKAQLDFSNYLTQAEKEDDAELEEVLNSKEEGA